VGAIPYRGQLPQGSAGFVAEAGPVAERCSPAPTSHPSFGTADAGPVA